MQALTVDGVRQIYHVAGRGPVCVVHPGGPGLHWAYLRSPELEERFTMVYLEPVGTGESGRLAGGDDYRLDSYVRFLAAVVDHLGQQRVYLLGHSHGGFVVLKYVLEHPDRVAGLILYATTPVMGPEFFAAATAAVTAYPQRFPDDPEAAAIPAAFQQLETAADDDTVSRALAAALPIYFADFWSRQAEFAAFRANIRAWLEPPAPDPEPFDLRPRLTEIAAPTVVIVGRHDFICGPTWAAHLAEGILGAQLTVLEHSGHFGHVEQPAHFADAAAQVLR